MITDQAATVRAWIDQSSPPFYLLKAEVVQAEQVKATASGKAGLPMNRIMRIAVPTENSVCHRLLAAENKLVLEVP